MLVDVLKRLKIEVPRVPFPVECYEFSRRHNIPDDIIADLAASSFASWVSIGPLALVPMPELVEQNTYSIGACIENGYLAIAGGANGDPVAVNGSTRRIVFVSHELLWSDDWSSISECIHPTPFNYEDFWEAIEADKNFPWDYYEALSRWPINHGGPRLWRPTED